MQPDFPAAHSMDTFWFAVDRDGHVAAFSSGEAGAVPVAGYLGEEWGGTLDALKKLPAVVEAAKGEEDDFEGVLNHGVFYFSHDKTENILAGPYSRKVPDRPVKVDRLPPDVREVVERVRFRDVSFENAAEIQPVDHFPCQSWDGAYLAKDGVTVKPVPGMEREYAESYDQVAKEIEEYKWEPPAPGSRTARPRVDVRVSDGNARRSQLIYAAILIVVGLTLLALRFWWQSGR